MMKGTSVKLKDFSPTFPHHKQLFAITQRKLRKTTFWWKKNFKRNIHQISLSLANFNNLDVLVQNHLAHFSLWYETKCLIKNTLYITYEHFFSGLAKLKVTCLYISIKVCIWIPAWVSVQRQHLRIPWTIRISQRWCNFK